MTRPAFTLFNAAAWGAICLLCLVWIVLAVSSDAYTEIPVETLIFEDDRAFIRQDFHSGLWLIYAVMVISFAAFSGSLLYRAIKSGGQSSGRNSGKR